MSITAALTRRGFSIALLRLPNQGQLILTIRAPRSTSLALVSCIWIILAKDMAIESSLPWSIGSK